MSLVRLHEKEATGLALPVMRAVGAGARGLGTIHNLLRGVGLRTATTRLRAGLSSSGLSPLTTWGRGMRQSANKLYAQSGQGVQLFDDVVSKAAPTFAFMGGASALEGFGKRPAVEQAWRMRQDYARRMNDRNFVSKWVRPTESAMREFDATIDPDIQRRITRRYL